MAGIMLLLMGIFKLGSLIKFIPRPVTVGFTAGIAVIIFTGQIGNFLGLTNMEQHEKFHMNVYEIASNIDTVNFYSLLVAMISFALILMAPKVLPKVPGALIGIIVSSVVTVLFYRGMLQQLAPRMVQYRIHCHNSTYRKLHLNVFTCLSDQRFVIAMLGGIESLLSAVVADGMTNSKHNSNRELIGQGLPILLHRFLEGYLLPGPLPEQLRILNPVPCRHCQG